MPAPTMPAPTPAQASSTRPTVDNRRRVLPSQATPGNGGRLTDILRGNSQFFDHWEDVKPANELAPVPAGTYSCVIDRGELTASRVKQTPCFKLTFRIMDGPFAGQLLWYEIWLTLPARSIARRDLDKIGLTDPQNQLEKPIPPGICCTVKVVKRTDDEGHEFNNVKSFVVTGITPPKIDPFAPLPPVAGTVGGDASQ